MKIIWYIEKLLGKRKYNFSTGGFGVTFNNLTKDESERVITAYRFGFNGMKYHFCKGVEKQAYDTGKMARYEVDAINSRKGVIRKLNDIYLVSDTNNPGVYYE